MARQCFFSFHYTPDCTRVAQVRNIGVVEGNATARDNDWETVVGGGDAAIKAWIEKQMHAKTCLVVLVGENTAGRKWINHEIVQAWDKGLGVVGIRIHGLKNLQGDTAACGVNPFEHITHGGLQKPLASIVKCYNPAGTSSKERYAWISQHLSAAVEEAIKIRNAN
jgi:MTH538 TIR-like domain (DUF1863)